MHIPDGYLSPSTCAALYGAAAPFWIVALRRVRRFLGGRTFPLIALTAAFSFVLMMFNLPLPGGTSGHATGIAVAAIVLGPWAAIASTSVALLIQALLFGDGGITTFGANAFNMAVVGTLVAAAVYRISTALASSIRARSLAAGIAGYCAINAAALCTSIELGLQPRLFHDALGAPLYAPYPLRVAVPAVMLGHLTLAGLVEAFLTAGVVAWLLRSEPERFVRVSLAARPVSLHRLRPAWIATVALMLLTPVGLLTAGSAWGEWSAADFHDPAARAAIVAASRNAPLPSQPPSGLARLAGVWTAPLRGYAPAFLQSATAGYLLSAMFGTGVILAIAGAAYALAREAR